MSTEPEDVVQHAKRTRARAARALRMAKDLLADGAPPASVSELARWTGLSDDFIRHDERAGALKAFRTRGGGKLLVPAAEAVRYLRQMGVL